MTPMQMLKEQTATAHERVEAAFSLSDRLASPARYLDLLQRLHAFHAAWEQEAERWIDPSLTERRQRAHLLQDDIAALGGELGVYPAPDFSFVTSEAAALGAMYVIEGSTLGGALIAKEVERRLGLTRDTGCAFFKGYGAELAARWRAFGAFVNARVAPEDMPRVVAAADATFDGMRAALNSDAPPQSRVAA